MYGSHNSSRHRSYNSRVLDQGTDRQRYRNADLEKTGEARKRTEAAFSKEGIEVALNNLRARYKGLIDNPDVPVNSKRTREKIEHIRELIRSTGAIQFSDQLLQIETDFRSQGHLENQA